GEYFNNEAFYGLISVELLALDGRWSNTLSGQIADTTRRGFAPEVPSGPSVFDYGNEGQRLKGSFTSSLRFGTDVISHRLTGAIDAERESFRNLSAGAFQGKRDTDTIGLVGQYELFVNDAFSFGASIRHDDNNRFDDVTTYRVQASYALGNGSRIRGAWGTGVKNPGYFELFGYIDGRYIGNPDLKPEKSEGWEAGIEQSFGADDWATIGATWFDSTLKGEIFTDYPAPDFTATPANRATTSNQHGIEAFASARPLPQLRFDLAYSWIKARENGAPEVRRPKHIASFNTTVSSSDQRFAGTLTL